MNHKKLKLSLTMAMAISLLAHQVAACQQDRDAFRIDMVGSKCSTVNIGPPYYEAVSCTHEALKYVNGAWSDCSDADWSRSTETPSSLNHQVQGNTLFQQAKSTTPSQTAKVFAKAIWNGYKDYNTVTPCN